MDFVERMTGRRRTFAPETMLKFTDLSPHVQKHLEKVYVTLAGALLVSAVGVVCNMLTGLGGWLAAIALFGCTFGLLLVEPTPYNLNKRYGLLAGAALAEGLAIGPLVDRVLGMHPGVLLTALMGTTVIFACFSAAAMLARRRSWLYLGGALSSAILAFAVLRLGTAIFGGRHLAYSAELYLGLLTFIGYILFDTQMIIERAYAGEKDHIKHAFELFIDFVAVFVRLLIILSDNADKKKSKRSKRDH